MARKIITISIDKELNMKLRDVQIKMIREKDATVSFSKVLETVLKSGLRQYIR